MPALPMSSFASIAVPVLLCVGVAGGALVPLFVQDQLSVFLTEPQSQTVELGSSVLLSCNASIAPTGYPLYPQLMVTWLKDGIRLDASTTLTIQQTGGFSSLQIRNVKMANAGYYQCKINDGPCYDDTKACPSLAMEANSYVHTYITLSAPAYLNVITNVDAASSTPPVIVAAAQEEPLLLECYPSMARGPDIAKWSFNGMQLTKNNSCKGCVLLLNQNLLIQHMTEASLGNYSCSAIWFEYNRQLKMTYIVHLNSDTYNGAEVITVDHPRIAKNGSNYELQCYTSPNMSISVVWQRNGKIIGRGHSLTFEVISTNDSGPYTCALEQTTSQFKSVNIDVLVPPVVSVGRGLQTLYIHKYETVQIPCSAYGNPTPTWLWYKNGKPLINQTLFITNEEYGIFQCFANNSAGVSYGTVRVLRYGIPNPPVGLQCIPKVVPHDVLGRAVLSWKASPYTGYPVGMVGESVSYSITACTNGKEESSVTIGGTLYSAALLNDVFTYFYYLSMSINGMSSGKTFCRVYPPERFLAPRDFDTVTCSENNASVTWTGVPSNEFVLTDDVSIWGYCLNGSNRTTAIQVNDLYQSVLDLSITGIGMEFICVFGGQFIINSDGRDHMYIIPTQSSTAYDVVSVSDHMDKQSANGDGLITLTCTDNRATLSWTTACLYKGAHIAITGICSNYSMDQMFQETSNSSRGTVIFNVSKNISSCFFHYLINGDLHDSSSGTLLCSFLDDDMKSDSDTMCNQDIVAFTQTQNTTAVAKQVSPLISTGTPTYFISSVVVAGAVVAITGVVVFIAMISFRKLSSAKSSAEKTILDELFTDAVIKEKDLLRSDAFDDCASNTTIIEGLTFPTFSPLTKLEPCSIEERSSLNSHHWSACHKASVATHPCLDLSETVELELYDKIEPCMVCEHATFPNKNFHRAACLLHCGVLDALPGTSADLPKQLLPEVSHNTSSGSNVTSDTCNFSGIE